MYGSETAVRVIEQFGNEHSQWQYSECLDVKKELMKIEDKSMAVSCWRTSTRRL